MASDDYFEIDFLAVETSKSGDAIAMRYKIDGSELVHVVDGGFADTGEKIIRHIDEYYGKNSHIHNVVLTHSDGDHARGLKYVLECGNIGSLWMNRPWLYVDELIGRFATYSSTDALKSRLKKCYPVVAELEQIAMSNSIPIFEAFQGTKIGAFVVMSPPRSAYLDLIVESEKTPEGIEDSERTLAQVIEGAVAKTKFAVRGFFAALWGEEIFSPEETSAENEMSVVQYAEIAGQKILLTGDTGRRGLQFVIDYAPYVALDLPGVDRFQVPHHGSRRNVSTELLDQILGEQYPEQHLTPDQKFTALISSALEDEHHPRKSVERAMRHRGGFVAATEGQNIRTSQNAPDRPGWTALSPRPYPSDQEQ